MIERNHAAITEMLCVLSVAGASASIRPQITEQAVLYAGQDFGVRVYERTNGTRPQATPVIRINGRWQNVQLKTWGDARGLMQRTLVYTGEDFGVRVHAPTTSSQPVATPVIRINGKWQEVELKPGPAK